MKIAITGKGGVGKTTIAGSLARYFASQGIEVLAIDADPSLNLASSIGIPEEIRKRIVPISEMKDLIAERTESQLGSYGTFFKMNPTVSDIPDRYVEEYKGVKLLVMGAVEKGGKGCICPESVLLKNLVNHLLIARKSYLIMDMEAGTEHLGRATAKSVDAFLIVVEPGKRSIEMARTIQKLALDIGITETYIIGNKISDDSEKEFIKENFGDQLIATFFLDKGVKTADLKSQSPFDLGSEEFLNEIKNIALKLEQIKNSQN